MSTHVKPNKTDKINNDDTDSRTDEFSQNKTEKVEKVKNLLDVLHNQLVGGKEDSDTDVLSVNYDNIEKNLQDNIDKSPEIKEEDNLDSQNDKTTIDTNQLKKLMQINYSYPRTDDPNLQYKLYKKREFNYHKIPPRPDLRDYNDIKEFRDNICARSFQLLEHQTLLSNFINPDTPYRGILIFHGVGTGKTCAAIAIAEKFKSMVQKYNTKIYILVPGPLLKDSWRDQLIMCTGETYKSYQDKSIYMDKAEAEKINKVALSKAFQFYKFMSYRSFYKRVLGIKIAEKKVVKGSTVKVAYKKTDEGEFERDISVDRIYNLNNSVIIVDEAHGLTGNAYGEALRKIIHASHNLRVILLTATPMKNLADDIVELLNFIRPEDSPMERDKIFNSYTNHLMDFKEGGLEYFKRMAKGYISHLRGADPLTYAKRVDKGVKPAGLSFTKVIQCTMLPYQRKAYDSAVHDLDDPLDRKSESVANFVFPGLSNDLKELVGYHGREGINIVKNQLKTHQELINKKIATEILKIPEGDNDLLYISENGKTITGKILKYENLKYFSIKFYKALKKIKRLVWGKKGSKTVFIHSGLVKVGIEIFQEVLLQNGYLEFQENPANYKIEPDTVCYFCGKTYKEHNKKHVGGLKKQHTADTTENLSDTSVSSSSDQKLTDVKKETNDNSESSSEYERKKVDIDIPEHTFSPSTFVTVTGKAAEETEILPEDKRHVLSDVFSSIENKSGKRIKFVLGSKVMNEGISLHNVGEVHILDVYFNLGRVDQAIGRAIRWCSHHKVMSEENKFPTVNVYKYAIVLENGLSSEINLYKKAEDKYLLIKKVERGMKEVSIDCPHNIYGNMFPEEIEENKHCGEKGYDPCPAICDYTKCDYKCDDAKLNAEYYDPNRKIYKKISKDKLDYSTFTHNFAKNEITYAKNKIKEMYIINYIYTLPDIVEYVKASYSAEKRDLFDPFFVYKALDELIPITENDFNNFKDTIVDKLNRPGFLIYNDQNYIFQPFDQPENIPMYYRTTYDKSVSQQLSLYNYLKNTEEYQQYKGKALKKDSESKEVLKDETAPYDFNSTMDYYENRDEYKYVGIIDKEISRRKNKQSEEIKDVFKIRDKRSKILDKKRGTGISSLFGAVCFSSKSKELLRKISDELKIDLKNDTTRISMCDRIRDKLLLMEKYSTGKNKMTYIMIPSNHPQYPFPYNLQDRVEFIKNKITDKIKFKLDITVKTEKKKTGDEKGNPSYKIIIKNDDKLKEFDILLKSFGAVLIKNDWTIVVE